MDGRKTMEKLSCEWNDKSGCCRTGSASAGRNECRAKWNLVAGTGEELPGSERITGSAWTANKRKRSAQKANQPAWQPPSGKGFRRRRTASDGTAQRLRHRLVPAGFNAAQNPSHTVEPGAVGGRWIEVNQRAGDPPGDLPVVRQLRQADSFRALALLGDRKDRGQGIQAEQSDQRNDPGDQCGADRSVIGRTHRSLAGLLTDQSSLATCGGKVGDEAQLVKRQFQNLWRRFRVAFSEIHFILSSRRVRRYRHPIHPPPTTTSYEHPHHRLSRLQPLSDRAGR